MSAPKNEEAGMRVAPQPDLSGMQTISTVDTSEKKLSKQERSRKSTREWRQANELAAWAHRAFQAALDKGLVVRQPCAECGATENVDFHHDPAQYDKPLHGVFLCRRHHQQLHRELKAVRS